MQDSNWSNKKMNNNYNRLLIASCTANASQAIYANMTALLMVPFMSLYGLTLGQMGILVGINFGTQILADVLLTFIIDKVKYKNLVYIANLLGFIGMILYCMSPKIMPANSFIPFVFSTIIFSFASGMLEVVLSPIVDTIPDTFKNKKAAMSLLHSFYAWWQAVSIVIIALCLNFLGAENWMYIIGCLSIVPVLNTLQFVPVKIVEERSSQSKNTSSIKVAKSPIYILCCIAIVVGAGVEIIMNQYVSTFCELNLGVSKLMSDMIGMLLFAVMLGTGRLIFGFFGHKINLNMVLIVSCLLAGVAYLLIGLEINTILSLVLCILVGLFSSMCWPGVISIAGEAFPKAGAWIFSTLAIFGDIGASMFGAIAGNIADSLSLSKMFLIISCLPFLCSICHIAIYALIKKKNKNINYSETNLNKPLY